MFSKTPHRSYDPNCVLKALTYPDRGVQKYSYDNDNQLLSYKIPGLDPGTNTLTYTYRWNSIQTITMPGGLKRTVTLDPLQRPERIEVKPISGTGAPIMDHRYEYDPVSNISKKTTLDGEYVYGPERAMLAASRVSLRIAAPLYFLGTLLFDMILDPLKVYRGWGYAAIAGVLALFPVLISVLDARSRLVSILVVVAGVLVGLNIIVFILAWPRVSAGEFFYFALLVFSLFVVHLSRGPNNDRDREGLG